jgi:ActR/RegA family two-component response regulator
MGHLPVDLVSADVFHQAPVETLARHLERTDYLVVVIASDREVATEIVEKAAEACDLAAQNGVPVLGLLARDASESEIVESSASASLVADIERSKAGAVQTLEHPAVATKLLSELFDARPRPGWVSGDKLPTSEVASELVRLTKENAELRETGISFQPGIPEESRWEPVVGALEDNKILIPVWNKSASVWEQPVEMSLFTFFSRIGPQLTVELSVADAAEFVPTGVCQLEAREGRPPWIIPLHSLNLWLTDLLALGLVAPSKRKHIRKDRNQYWSLTTEGREFLAYVRRNALNAGGHRHVGFTSEFPIVVPYGDEDD